MDTTLLSTDEPVEGPRSPLRLPDRYTELGRIGIGGMGEVYRVADRVLGRTVAMKVLRDDRTEDGDARRRFLEEARVTAQLQHPGIIPVYDLGRLADGRAYYTMREVRGRTLAGLIQEVHAAATGDVWRPSADGWTFRQLLDTFTRACEAVAYAHQRGVVHRDLKPTNLLVGEFGDMQVVDWGIARVLGQPIAEEPAEPTATVRRGAPWETRDGDILGTPAYMAPEQARGDVEDVGRAADVYALGAILREILTGRPPWQGPANAVFLDMMAGLPPLAATPLTGPPVPPELVAAADKATQFERDARYPDAAALTEELSAWLQGARRRDQALAIVAEADALWPIAETKRADAVALREQADALRERLPPLAPEADRRPVWSLEDAARTLEIEQNVDEARWLQTLQSALQIVPELPEAHERLGAHYRSRLVAAEERQDARAAAALDSLVRIHDDGRNAAWIRGDARIEVPVDPPDATCVWHRVVDRDRRLVPEPHQRAVGLTATLFRGSWIAELSAPGRATVRYPVQLGRGEHFTGIAPGDTAPTPIRLPDARALGPDDVWIPPGRFVCGGDSGANDAHRRAIVWLDGFVIQRHPITVAAYLAFLDELARTDGVDAAWARVPRSWVEGRPFASWNGHGFVVGPDGSGHAPEPNHPIALVSALDADAYAAWWAARSGHPWRLPTGLEREKAARGADARLFPWGNAFEAGRNASSEGFAGPPTRVDVAAYPDDTSPYGVRQLAGNVRDWCANAWSNAAPAERERPGAGTRDQIREVRGGTYANRGEGARAAARYGAQPTWTFPTVGFRLARTAVTASG